MSDKYNFEPDGSGRRLTAVFAELGINLDTRCAEMGKCGGCKVELISGELVQIHTGERIRGRQIVYGCLHALSPDSPAEILVPQKSIISEKSSAVAEFRVISEMVRGFPEREEYTRDYSIAIDVGTTTVALMLVKIADEQILGSATAFNSQIKYGDNVLTRIKHCQGNAEMVVVLQQEIMQQTLLPLMRKLLAENNITFAEVQEVVITGNTTMQHLCAGVNPETIGVSPFIPVFTAVRELSLVEAFGVSGDEAKVLLLPSVSAYLGADVLAGALVSGVVESREAVIIVDVGTNGEMILNTGSLLAGCSTAAGPAFEGAGLSSGTRAAEGAVSHLKIAAGKVELEVIGEDAKVNGICGTAYFDFFAWAVREDCWVRPEDLPRGLHRNTLHMSVAGIVGWSFACWGVKKLSHP